MHISSQTKPSKRGFTLIELLIAMTVTIIIVGVLMGMTKIAVSGFNKAQARIQTSAAAKEVLDTISKDLEAMVIRNDGNNYEWLFIKKSDPSQLGPDTQKEIENPLETSFFSAVTDRYNGNIGGSEDKGGDISLIRYRLVYQNTISSTDKYRVFSLYRERIEPDVTFRDYLAKTKIDGIKPSHNILDRENFLAENIYDFTLIFNFQFTKPDGTIIHKRVPITANGDFKTISIKGNGIEVDSTDINSAPKLHIPADAGKARLVSIDVSLLVLSDAGMNGLKNAKITDKKDLAKYLKKYGKHFAKTVNIPTP